MNACLHAHVCRPYGPMCVCEQVRIRVCMHAFLRFIALTVSNHRGIRVRESGCLSDTRHGCTNRRTRTHAAHTCVAVNGHMTATEVGRRNKAVTGISLYVRL